jgi:triacylglycerol lipase
VRRFTVVIASLVALLGSGAFATPAQAAPLPVTYNFVLGAAQQGLDPSPNAPGTNIWTCKPSAAHPRPVILVHGTAGTQDTNWATYGPLLRNNGYCVFALTYGALSPGAPIAGLGKIEDSARQLAAFVTKVRTATGASRVDLVGHSQGTLMPNYYAKYLGGAKYIYRYISLAPLWHGTAHTIAFNELAKAFQVPDGQAPLCPACTQMATGSAFMTRMRTGSVAVSGIQYTNIVTRYDQIVVPYTSGLQSGMRNVVLQDVCPTDLSEHLEIAASPTAARIVLNTLDPSHSKAVQCQVVLPYVGPLL